MSSYSTAAGEFRSQWTQPAVVFAILLVVGGDVVARALAQLAGEIITPVAFSFGWVAYAFSALLSTFAEYRLMPPHPDCACLVINGKSGYARDNKSWVLGRIVRDFEHWMDREIRKVSNEMTDNMRVTTIIERPVGEPLGKRRPGLCVSIYEPDFRMRAGVPRRDWIYYSGFIVITLQLGIAAIPLAINGDWGILLITAVGTLLSLILGGQPQWRKEKWRCRHDSSKTLVLTRGNGHRHAIVIIGNGRGLDLEDMAADLRYTAPPSLITRLQLLVLCIFWGALLITASGKEANTWYLIAVGALGTLYNLAIATFPRRPSAFGIHLNFKRVFARSKVMETLLEVEENLPHVGRSLLHIFFPGELREGEVAIWAELEKKAKGHMSQRATVEKDDGTRREELWRLANQSLTPV